MSTRPGPKVNHSAESKDGRAIGRSIMEKAAFGAVPVDYKIESHHDWQTVQWMHNPELFAVRFSDGSVIYVAHAAGAVNQELNSNNRTLRMPGTEAAGQLFHDADSDQGTTGLDEAESRRLDQQVDDELDANLDLDLDLKSTPSAEDSQTISKALKGFMHLNDKKG